MSNLSYNLNRILTDGGHAASIDIQTHYKSMTQIDIIERDLFIYARIEIEFKTLPVKIKLFNKEVQYGIDGKEIVEYGDDLPEDLKVFISMNQVEPNAKKHDMQISEFAEMNKNRDNVI